MRVLKDGTVKYKASAYKESQRLGTSSFPLPRFVKGARVQIYMGAGWSTATVVESTQAHCVVQISINNRMVTVRDARNIRPAS